MNKNKILLATALSTAVLVGCGENQSKNQAMPAPLVITQEAIEVTRQRSIEYVGRISAPEDVSISAQVTGYLKSRHFKEGQMVTKGQLLYQIEPATFEAQVASAKASLAQANAALKKAELDFDRGEDLLPKGNISKSEFDTLTANKLGAQAQVEAAKAQLTSAEVSLSHTRIVAPFDGRISESEVSIGDLLSPSSGVLTTLVSLDPIHASFNVSERERLEMGMDEASGDGSGASQLAEVQVILENGEAYPEVGQIDYIGNRIDLNTGTIGMRAVVANPEQVLLPGQHIKVSLREKASSKAVTIPRRAVQTDLEGDFVMLLTEGNIAERRNVVLGKQVETGIVIKEGLSKGDVVITKGLQRVRNGVPVRIDEAAQSNVNPASEG
ncbi:efflux RND transporter periplasmic adaptor subunit [Vibrio sp. HN007]|uniref:efflux RND transporter periplasmic adaptor subunit n=1 Tax=Vibrio iocasae TaxID=3098914 RepID=UPI0035D52907